MNDCIDDYIPRKAVLKVIYTSTAPALEVKAMPAADVVEIVHCKECKFGEWNAVECAYWCQGHFRRPDWYCADAKSKDGGKNE